MHFLQGLQQGSEGAGAAFGRAVPHNTVTQPPLACALQERPWWLWRAWCPQALLEQPCR